MDTPYSVIDDTNAQQNSTRYTFGSFENIQKVHDIHCFLKHILYVFG